MATVEVRGSHGVAVTLADGEQVEAEAVVCALPAGPLRAVSISGLSDERLASLRAQRHALAAKVVVAYEEPFWQRTGRTGSPRPSGCSAPPGHRARGVLSLLVAPERFSAFRRRRRRLAAQAVLDGLRALYGDRAREPQAMLERAWGSDPFTLGYITSWAPGDLIASVRCTAPTSRRSTSPAPTTGWPATWRARSGPAAPRRRAALGARSPA